MLTGEELCQKQFCTSLNTDVWIQKGNLLSLTHKFIQVQPLKGMLVFAKKQELKVVTLPKSDGE